MEFARQLAGRAQTLVLVARRRERLEKLRDELEGCPPWRPGEVTGRDSARPSTRTLIYTADLSRPEEINALLEWVAHEKITIDLLINNAGLGDHGPFATSEPTRVDDIMQVNVVALTLLTRRLLPPMIAAKRGAILNVSSSASFLPLPDLAVYAASKAYVTSFSEALRMELHGTGVTVSALCPGPVQTEFNTIAKRPDGPKKIGPSFTYVSVEEVVRVGLKAVENDRPLVIPGWLMKVAMLLVRLTPMPVLRLASRVSK